MTAAGVSLGRELGAPGRILHDARHQETDLKGRMAMIETRQLEYFVGLAEQLHFGRAAHSLGIAQPPLSQQIKKLERVLGVELFRRNSRNVELTPAGAALLPAARRALHQVEVFEGLAVHAREGRAGWLRIGFVSPALHRGLPRILRDFRRECPSVEVSASQMSVADQAKALEDDVIDVGFTFSELTLGAHDSFELAREELVLVLPEDHQRAGEEVIELASLSAETFIGYATQANSDISAFVTRACLAAGFAPRITHHGPQIATGIGMVAAGLGITLVPVTEGEAAIEGVVFRRVAPPTPTIGFSLIFDGRRESPVTRRFVQYTRGFEFGLRRRATPDSLES